MGLAATSHPGLYLYLHLTQITLALFKKNQVTPICDFFLTVLGFCCYAWVLSSSGKQGLLSIVSVQGLLLL